MSKKRGLSPEDKKLIAWLKSDSMKEAWAKYKEDNDDYDESMFRPVDYSFIHKDDPDENEK